MPPALREPITLAPFVAWIEDRVDRDSRTDEILAAGGDAKAAATSRVARDLGWGDAAGTRRLYRYRNGEQLTGLVERAVIEDALEHAGADFYELYPELAPAAGATAGLIITAFCPACEEDVVPNDDGTCVWCDTQTGGHDELVDDDPARIADRSRCRCGAAKSTNSTMCRSCASSLRDGQGRKRALYDPLDYVCRSLGPNCSGSKAATAQSCWGCYADAGSHTGRHHRKGQNLVHVTEAQLLEAKRLYATGLSIRKVAARLYPETTYASERSCANSLFDAFRARGWPLRDKGVASRAGMRRKAAELPQCTFVKASGSRCDRRTTRPGGRCWHHDEEILASRLEYLHALDEERAAA